MEWFIKAFIRASLLWFAGGILLGLSIAIHPAWLIYRPAHAHMTVVGFLTMLVFGVGYSCFPDYSAIPCTVPAWPGRTWSWPTGAWPDWFSDSW